MSALMALSIVTGVLCGIWTQASIPIGLMTWAGFAGTTTYFASGEHGLKGFLTTIRQNMFGVLCGLAIVFLSNTFAFPGALLVWSGLVTYVMCIAGNISYLSFIPGTFVGSFSVFAAGGNYMALVISLLIGAALGVACDLGGTAFHSLVGGKEEPSNVSNAQAEDLND